MNVLMVNKFYYNFGGAENYMFGLSKLLKERGHNIIPFSMEHPSNFKTEYEKYFVSEISYNGNSKVKNIRYGLSSIYSFEARAKISSLLSEHQVDLAHLHNFNFQLTPSILFELKRRGIPVIITLHDPQIICPHHRLFNYEERAICEKCNGGKYYNAFKTKCIKNSYLKGFLGMMESYVYHLSGIYEKVDLFISPSNFLKTKINEFGLKNLNIKVIPNFYIHEIISKEQEYNNEVLYIGRVSEEKGLSVLLKAMSNIKDIRLKIIGDGLIKDKLKKEVDENGLNNIEFLGHLPQNKIKTYLGNCMLLVVPSVWYENCPLTIIEAMINGKAVIASRLGGNVDLIEEGKTGLLFNAGDADDLATKINYAIQN